MMTNKLCMITLIAMVLTAGSTTALAADSEPVRRVYSIQYLGLEQAHALVEEEVPAVLDGQARIDISHLPRRSDETDSPRGVLRIVATLEIHESITELLEKFDVPPPTLLFQLFLLEASMQSSARPDLPAGAKQALADLQGFLPFKGYTLIESGMVRASSESHIALSEEWQASILFRSHRRAERPLIMEGFRLVRTTRDESGPHERPILDTTFSMNVGETVVVGTSKLNGDDRALVVLLTVGE
jgi:hypothetical protein